MIKVLVITGILPIPEIEAKKKENDIILVTEDKIHANFKEIKFHYFFILPYANKFLSLLSKKWSSYYFLRLKKNYILRGRKLTLLGIFNLPRKLQIRKFLFEYSFRLNKKNIEVEINQFRPTIIHAQGSDSAAFLAKKISETYNIPYIVTLRGLNFCSDNLIKENIKNARKLIAISPTQLRMAKGLTDADIKFIPHGVSEEFFKKRQYEICEPIRFVAVCILLKRKNIDKVINAFSKIEGDFQFDIYGDGPEYSYLMHIITENGLGDKIRLKGYVSHDSVSKLLMNYDLFVMPSKPETLGRVYFEAMAGGLPIIASEGTGVDGIITDGKEGFLVNIEDNNSLENCLLNIIKNPTQLNIMSKNAYMLAKQFKWEKIVYELIKVYNHG